MKKNERKFLAGCLLLTAFTLSLPAENWPRFRGPNGQGRSSETGLPVQWTPKDYLWTVTLPGEGHSSPITWSDKVWVTAAAKNNRQGWLLCLDAATGKELWKKEYACESPPMNSLNNLASSTPAADDKQVYCLWYGKEQTLLLAFDHKGKEIWQKDFGPTLLRHGPTTSPIVYKDLVIFTQEQEGDGGKGKNRWHAVDKATGEIRWTLPRQDAAQGAYSTPCVWTDATGKEQLIVSSTRHGLTAVETATGQVVWEAADILPDRVVSSPILAGELIINTCGSGGGGKQLTAIKPGMIENGRPQVAYTSQEKFVPYVSTGVYANGNVYLFHDGGPVTCMDSQSGQVKWTQEPAGRYYSSPVYADGKIYCMDMDGKVVILKAAAYELLGTVDLGEKTQASIAISNGQMLLRTQTQLRCLKFGQ